MELDFEKILEDKLKEFGTLSKIPIPIHAPQTSEQKQKLSNKTKQKLKRIDAHHKESMRLMDEKKWDEYEEHGKIEAGEYDGR